MTLIGGEPLKRLINPLGHFRTNFSTRSSPPSPGQAASANDFDTHAPIRPGQPAPLLFGLDGDFRTYRVAIGDDAH
ncbi:MAG: hypothetical protein U0905_06120 [Pirellulales bacterium]